MMLCDVSLSVTYIGPKLRTQRPWKTKICTVVAHVTRDLDTTFKVKRSRSGGRGILWRPPAYSLLRMMILTDGLNMSFLVTDCTLACDFSVINNYKMFCSLKLYLYSLPLL